MTKSTKDLMKIIKEQEEKIQQLETILSLMPGHVYWLDRNNIYLGCNDEQAKSAGLKSRSEIIGKKNSDMVWKEQAPYVNNLNEKVMRTGQSFEFEEKALNVQGERVYLSRKVPLKDKKGNISGLLGISLDITERKEQEKLLKLALEKADLANKSKSEFLSIMSHELRGPFSNIIGLVELIQVTANDPSALPLHLSAIVEQIKKALALLENVIYLLQLENSNFRAESVPIDIKNYIESIIANANIHSHIAVKTEIAPNLPDTIKIDSQNLRRVATILLSNAAKFTEHGNITIALSIAQPNQLTISIKDTGIGLSSEQQANIFNTFITPEQQSSNFRYRKPGVKLSIAKKLVQLMGGDLALTSQIGVGTTVTINIPYSPAGEISPDNWEPSKRVSQNESNYDLSLLKVLLVEDDPTSLALEAHALKALGCQVTTAKTGLQAIELVNKQFPDLIFMDITLPDIDGVEVTKRIWGKFGPVVDVVAVTSHASEDDVKYFTENGMVTALLKPVSQVDFEHFLKTYAKILKERQSGEDD